jgi:hypothetical protein
MYLTFYNDSATKVDTVDQTYEMDGHLVFDPLNWFLPNLT